MLMDATWPCGERTKQKPRSFGCTTIKKVKMSRLGRIPKRVVLFSYLMILIAAYPTGAAENQSQTVRVKIGTILANNQSDEIDPKLNAMKNQLKVMKYRSYRLLKEETQSVPWQGNAAFDIPGGRSLV